MGLLEGPCRKKVAHAALHASLQRCRSLLLRQLLLQLLLPEMPPPPPEQSPPRSSERLPHLRPRGLERLIGTRRASSVSFIRLVNLIGA
jgi:hypothetical protein